MSAVGARESLVRVWRVLCLATAFGVAGGALGADPLPEFYGVYVVDDGQLVELRGEHGQEIGQRTPNVRLLVFDKRVASFGQPDFLRLARMKWLRNEIELVGKRVLVGRPLNAREKVTAAGQWLSGGRTKELDVELRFKPVPGQSEMIYLVPRMPLAPGAYEVLRDGRNVGYFLVQTEAEGGIDDPDSCVDRVRWKTGVEVVSELIRCDESGRDAVGATSQSEEKDHASRLKEYVDKSTSLSDEPRQQFRDQKLGFGFSYPESFVSQSRNVRHSSTVLTPPPAGVDGAANMMILVEAGKTPLLDPNPNVGGIVERQIAVIGGNLSDPVVIGPLETTMAGEGAQVVFVSGERDGRAEEQAFTIAVGRKRWMTVTLLVQGGSLDQYLEEYRRVCDSLELF